MTRTAPAGGSLDRQRAPRTAAWPLSPSEPRPPPPAPRPGAPGLQAWATDPSTSVTPWVAVSSQPRAADPPERGPLEDRSQSRCPEPAGVPARAPGGRARLLGLCAVPEGPPRPPSCPGSGPGACPHHLLGAARGMSPVVFSQRPHSIRLAPSGHPAPGTWRCGEQAHALGHAIHGGTEPRACTQHPRETICGRPDLLGTHFPLGPAVGLGAVDGEPARPRPAPGLSQQPAARARRPHPGCTAGPARGSWPGSPRTGLGPCQPGAGSHRSQPPPLTVQVAAVPPGAPWAGAPGHGHLFLLSGLGLRSLGWGRSPREFSTPSGFTGGGGEPGDLGLAHQAACRAPHRRAPRCIQHAGGSLSHWGPRARGRALLAGDPRPPDACQGPEVFIASICCLNCLLILWSQQPELEL